MSNDELPLPVPATAAPMLPPMPMAGDVPPPIPQELPPPLPAWAVRVAGSSVPKSSEPANAASDAATRPGRRWWVFCLAGAFACFVLFLVCLNCNPATTATDRALGKLQGAIAQSIEPDLHPLLSWGFSVFFNKYLVLPYAQMQAAGFSFSFIACLLIPVGSSLVSVMIGHPVFLLGGAPGGWRATMQSFGLHRLICDGFSLLFLALALWAPMEPAMAAAVLVLFLPFIRLGALIALWCFLGRAHGFGPARVIFLGLPHIFLGALFSGMLALVLALYFYAYLIARSF